MTNENIKETLALISQRVPGIVKLVIPYHGSGDSFEDYGFLETFDQEEQQLKFPPDLEHHLTNVTDEVIERSNINFDGNGCDGEITIDFAAQTVMLDNFDIYTTREPGISYTLEL